MSLTFVLGRCGAGKSRYIRAEILKKNCLDSAVFIVPQQYTVQAERDLINEGARGLFCSQVLSFKRLTHKILSSEGGQHVPFLDAMGKCFKARLALNTVSDELTVYNADTIGLPKLLSAHFDYFQRFDVAPEELSNTVRLLNEGYTKHRLTDVARVYDEYRKQMSGIYSAEDLIDRVIDAIPSCDWLKRSSVFIDGFEQIDSQTYRILSALMNTVPQLMITFCLDDDCASLFKPEAEHFNKCMELAGALDIVPKIIKLPDDEYKPRHMNPQFSHLERYMFDYTRPCEYGETPEGIEAYQFTDPYAEADYAAAKLIELARDGLRWRDMAVVCADESFAALVSRVFAEYDIPCFMDRKQNVASAIAEFMLSALRVVSMWGAEDVICMLKTGLSGLSDDDCELFENYCIRYGIKPDRVKKPFEYGDYVRAETVRSAVIPGLTELETAFKASQADIMIDAVLAYLARIDLDGRVQTLIEALPKDALSERLRLSEILTGLYELLNQAKIALGSMKISVDELYGTLLDGFLSRESAIIPTGADEVLIADIRRSKLSNVKALFLMDAADGKLPITGADDGLISERDIDALMHYGVKLGRTANEISNITRFQLYQTICKPDRYIRISVSALNLSGEEQKPSSLFDMLRRIFPKLTITKNVPLTDEMASQLVCAKRASARHCVRFYGKGGFWPVVYEYLSKDVDTKNYLTLIDSFNYEKRIGRSDAKRLYSGNVSVTGIEAYYQCPFMHFMQRGIRPVKRPVYAFEKKDVGSFLHMVMDGFTSRLIGESGERLTDESFLYSVMDNAFDDCLARHKDILSGADTAHIVRRLRRTAQIMLKKLMNYLMSEGGRIAGSEVSFGAGGSDFPGLKVRLDGGDVYITGKVDRVDVDSSNQLHISDYKTGGMSSSLPELKNDLYNGIRLQLMMYTNMVLEYAGAFGVSAARTTPVSGADYISLRDEIVPCKLDDAQYASLNSRVNTPTRKGIHVGDKTRDGEITDETMREWLDFAMKKSKEGLCGIFSGDITARPLNKKDICAYCDYSAICGFEGRVYRKYEKVERGFDD